MDRVSAASLDARLRETADPGRAVREKRYLKSDLTHYGVSVPAIHTIAREAARDLDRDRLLRVVADLWDEPSDAPVHERRALAADLLAHRTDLLVLDDVPLVERLLREARTWALVDTLAPSVVGPLDERLQGALTPTLDRWVQDDDLWLRRSALLAHLRPLRQGRGDWARFTRYAEALLGDREFFVAKAIGWVVRDTARYRPDLVLPWLEQHIVAMRPVTAREAIKPFAPADQSRLKALHRGEPVPRDGV